VRKSAAFSFSCFMIEPFVLEHMDTPKESRERSSHTSLREIRGQSSAVTRLRGGLGLRSSYVRTRRRDMKACHALPALSAVEGRVVPTTLCANESETES